MESLRSARPDLKRLTIAGHFRRGCGARRQLLDRGRSADIRRGAPNSECAGGLQVYLTDRRRFGVALLFATGLAAHLNELQALAADKRMQLDPDGLHKGRRVIAAKEEDIYRALGSPLHRSRKSREGRGEIAASPCEGELPRLVTDKDLAVGILHCHTDASDGTETLETMAKAMCQRGFEYFGVADHSKSAHYAGGLSVERIEEQHREVDRVNREFGKDFRILEVIEF